MNRLQCKRNLTVLYLLPVTHFLNSSRHWEALTELKERVLEGNTKLVLSQKMVETDGFYFTWWSAPSSLMVTKTLNEKT